MPPETRAFGEAGLPAWTTSQRIVAALWLAALTIICARVPCGWHDDGVYGIYVGAAERWLAVEDPYQVPGATDLYRYPPPATMLLSAFAVWPRPIGLLLWQVVNFASFMGGFTWFARRIVVSRALSRHQHAALWLLLLPLALPSLANGQANPLMVGLLLAGLAGAAAERWRIAASCIALACAIKVYPLAVALLLIVAYSKEFARPFAAALAVCLLAPFLVQPFDFVAEQWRRWLEVIALDTRWLLPPERSYRDLWLLLRLSDAPVSLLAYRVMQLTLAGLVAILCWCARRSGMSRRQVLGTIAAQANCWLILCGPSSEWATYILLAPVLSWMAVAAWRVNRAAPRVAVVAVLSTFLLHAAVRIVPGGSTWIWQFLPASALTLWSYCLWQQLSEIRAYSLATRQEREERIAHGLVKA
ncbi:MAG: DUF2029 domain-containing protein [Planctomycetes bacterium]|nr:DUF2029 domain-containing protein [Planctomycetota bacterium]